MEMSAGGNAQVQHRDLHQVDLPVDTGLLNECFMEIGLWLVEWEIPHLARVISQPRRRVLSVAFPDRRHARAFQLRFGGQSATSSLGKESS
jgi:tRNA A37 threonylcarbamoyladenosine biosynthesis protein TsaE